MSYDEFKQLSREVFREEYSYFCIERTKIRDHGTYYICNERKNT